MNVLVVGGGGREHALVWKLVQSPKVSKIYCAPGNAGIAKHCECVSIKAEDIDGLVEFAKFHSIHLTVVGPELPLTLGIVDRFQSEGLKIFGPNQKAAILEASKVFTKDFCKKYNIPTAEYESFKDSKSAISYINQIDKPVVVKADGLAAGKGVIICQTAPQAIDAVNSIMISKEFGESGNEVVVEEYLDGEEASFIVFSDGDNILPLASSQDHKRAFDNDLGPNTGGMGAYSPAPVLTDEVYKKAMDKIIRPTIKGMKAEGRRFVGVLYAGLMIKNNEPKLLEYNVRMGDPETQPILIRLKSDLVELMEAVCDGKLDQLKLEWDPRPSVCVVMASDGYPASYEKGFEISGLDEASEADNVVVFHAGTVIKNGRYVNNGGRVLGVTALGKDIKDAITRTYEAVGKISWKGVHFRNDIGQKALNRT